MKKGETAYVERRFRHAAVWFLLSIACPVQAAIRMPTDVAGCVLWLDAADTGSVIETEGRVSEWRDKSDSGAHVTQGTAYLRPVSGQTTLNGHNTLTFTNDTNMAGLILMFEDPDANTFDHVKYGAYAAEGIRVEGPGVSSPATALAGVISDIRLRIRGRKDSFRFEYSEDGELWTTLSTLHLPGKVLLHAGLFANYWSQRSGLTAEFDYLVYEAAPIQPGTIVNLR